MHTQKKSVWITLLRSGNRLVIDPTTPRVKSLLEAKLSYVEKKFFHGPELAKRKRMHLPPCENITWECFSEDHRGRLATSYGFLSRIRQVLKKAGFKVRTRWALPEEAALAEQRSQTVYKPHWERIDRVVEDGYQFRYMQKEALQIIAEKESGRISCPPGWGKGDTITQACMLFAKAKIAVVTRNVAVLHQRLFPALSMALPSVGIVGGGKKIKGRRVMCYTAGSLHHAQGDEDFVFVDEGDQACSDVYAERMAMFDHARIWMFSATWDMRLDNKNMRAEAMAGPIRLRVSYREAEDNKMVLPVEVFLTDVITDVNPCTDFDGYEKKRAGIWAHEYRNSLIAADANRYDDDVQILITVDTVEHGLYLQRLLPNFAFVYAGKNLKSYQLKAFHEKGLIDDDWQIMTDERKAKLTRRFEKGYLKKAIATTVWNVGVNFKGLQVIIRADGSGSPANDTQVPGRAVRLHDDKQVAIVHDYLDQFDTGYHAKAEHRIKSYEANEWTVHRPDKSKKSRLRQLMLWGER